jgi:hypothetical protein
MESDGRALAQMVRQCGPAHFLSMRGFMTAMATVRIALVSFRMPADLYIGRRDGRRAELAAMFAEARLRGATHVLLPGWSLVYTPTEQRQGEPARDLDWLATESSGLHVMAELTLYHAEGSGFRSPPAGLGFVLIEDGHILPQRIRQVFSESGHVQDRNDLYVMLADQVFGGARSVQLGGVWFFVLVCGEINLLTNLQGQGNVVRLRHEAPGQRLADLQAIDYRVAFNPAHTEMGNLGKMHRRWEFLSQPHHEGNPRTCLFTTNVTPDSPAGSAMYCFEKMARNGISWPSGTGLRGGRGLWT